MKDPGARRRGGATSAAILTWFALAPTLVGSASLTDGGAVGDGGPATAGAAAFVAVLATGAVVTVLMAGRRLARASRGDALT